jgi:ABC-type uncharacterized transport system permease subunit
VSTNDAIGSAAKASAAGNAIVNISSPSSSNLRPSLQFPKATTSKLKEEKKKKLNNPMHQFQIAHTSDGEHEKKTIVKDTKWVAGPGRPEHEKLQTLALGAGVHSPQRS